MIKYQKIPYALNELIYRKHLKSCRIARDFFEEQSLLKSCDIGTSTVILKKEIFTDEIKFPSIKTKEDFVLWLRILKKNIKIVNPSKINFFIY